MATTTNYSWTIPDVGGSNGSWGTILNTLFQAIDTAVFTVAGVANAALARAGGAMTGRLDAHTATMKRQDLGSVSGAQALNLATAQVFTLTVSGSTTLSLTNVPTGTLSTGVILQVTNGASNVIWPAGTRWPGLSTPSLTTSGTDIVALFTNDAGTTWRAWIVAQNV